jgi:hypothetical protein
VKKRLLQAVRAVCVLYWAGLTVLLLAPDPAALLGMERPPGTAKLRGVHLAFFLVLGVLIAASRWPPATRWMAGLTIGYAILTELLQGLVPNRTVELLDLAENLAGLALGAAAWWLTCRAARGLRGTQEARPL